MANKTGIVDKKQNPFARKSWIQQGYSFTKYRQGQFDILGKSFDEIWKIDPNIGRYLAFVSIRWGFAEMKDNRLVPIEKWHNRDLYDGFGNLITNV